jgi:hypothetical protein
MRLHFFEDHFMFKISALLASLLFVSGAAFAQAADSCEAKALSKDGKPLAGAAKAASVKKCEGDAKAAAPACADKAMSKDGKPLAGAAKNAFIKKCEADAKGAK